MAGMAQNLLPRSWLFLEVIEDEEIENAILQVLGMLEGLKF